MKQLKNIIALSLTALIAAVGLMYFTKVSHAAQQTPPPAFKQLLEQADKTDVLEQMKEKKKKNDISVESKHKTTERIVVFDHTLSDSEIKSIENTYNVKFKHTKAYKNDYAVVPKDEVKFDQLAAAQGVQATYNNDIYKIDAPTPTPTQQLDWGIGNIQAQTAWNFPTPATGTNVVVAVIDTGIQTNHPDLVTSIQTGGRDFYNNDLDPSDDNGHGTHVSGIIAAANNTVGYVGEAYSAKILPLKVCGASGNDCDSLAIANAIDYAISQNVDIINMSFGGGPNDFIQAALNRASTAGILLVAAAGNSGTNGCLYPAAYSNVVCVGAIDNTDTKAAFSNYGQDVDNVAPGVGVFSTYPETLGDLTGYASMNGTSMATPYYVGAAALIESVLKANCTPESTSTSCTDKAGTTRSLIIISARDLGIAGPDTYYGYGAVDLSPLFAQAGPGYTTTTATVMRGSTLTHALSFVNGGANAINITKCSVNSQNISRVQTIPAFAITTLNEGTTPHTSPVNNGLHTTFTFDTPITVAAAGNTTFGYDFTVSAESVVNDMIYYSFDCTYDDASTTPVETYRTLTSYQVATVDWPTYLKNVYFTFWKFKYGAYVSPSQYKTGDNISLKNYNGSKISLISISLYDYTKKGNQCYSRTWKNSTTIYMKACNLLPTGRKYAAIFKFQDKGTGVVKTMYFVNHTIRPGLIVY